MYNEHRTRKLTNVTIVLISFDILRFSRF